MAGSNIINGQDLYRSGLLPALTISKGLPAGFSLNLSAESRQSLLRGEFGGDKEWKYNYNLTDLSLLGSKKLGLNYRIAIGYLARIREGLTVHRAIQQLTFVRTYSSFRSAHRFAADQSFASGLSMELRIRYRFTAEIPLSGQAADVGVSL